MHSRTNYSFSKLKRCRWNVLDLITIVARSAVPAYYFCDIDMSAVEKLRSHLAVSGVKVTITAILLKAVAIAQLTHPASRRFRLPWGTMVTLPTPVAGFTVERLVENNPTVFFGTIMEPIAKSLEEMAQEIKLYADCPILEVPQLNREDTFRRVPWMIRQLLLWLALCFPSLRRMVNPATFGLSTLGKFGVHSLLAPCVCSCIFGVGVIERRVVPAANRVEIRPILTLSLSFDTKVLDMYKAAAFFSEVKQLLESGLAGYLGEVNK